jgi:hypothetical protein
LEDESLGQVKTSHLLSHLVMDRPELFEGIPRGDFMTTVFLLEDVLSVR